MKSMAEKKILCFTQNSPYHIELWGEGYSGRQGAMEKLCISQWNCSADDIDTGKVTVNSIFKHETLS